MEAVKRRRVRTRQVKRSVLDDGHQILRPDEDDLTCGDGVNL
jgi:hypothetical protein